MYIQAYSVITMVNNNDIVRHLIDIKEDTAGIKQHLKDLNGKVARNVNEIGCNKKEIDSLKITMAKYAGGITVIMVAIQIAMNILI